MKILDRIRDINDFYESLMKPTSEMQTQLFKYILNIPEYEEYPNQLSKSQKNILNQFISFMRASGGFSLNSRSSAYPLSSYSSKYETIELNSYRIKSGGTINKIYKEDDPFFNKVGMVLQDIWPLYLLDPYEHDNGKLFFSNLSLSITKHPKFRELYDFFISKQNVKSFFMLNNKKNTDSDNVIQFNVFSSVGGSTINQIETVLVGIIENTVYLTMINGKVLSHESISQSLNTILYKVESLLNVGFTITTKITGFNGIKIDEDKVISLKNGIIRNPTSMEINYIFDKDDKPSLIYQRQCQIEYHFAPNCENMEEMFTEEFGEKTKKWSEDFLTDIDDLDVIRFAFLLSSDKDNNGFYPRITKTASVTIAPLNSSPAYNSYEHLFSEPLVINVENFKHWYDIVTNELKTSMKIARTRILKASSERDNHVDSLIDSIIVWENMLGSKTETAFKVTGSIAKLLEPQNSNKRKELLKRLKDIYNKRSLMVHGATDIDNDEAFLLNTDAIDYAIKCLKILYTERSDLLELTSSEKRSEIVLLDFNE